MRWPGLASVDTAGLGGAASRRAVQIAAGIIAAFKYWLGDVLETLRLPRPAALRRPFPLKLSEVYQALAILSGRGCAICRHEEESVRRGNFWFLIESYGEGPCIGELIGARGFCPLHFWRLGRTESRYALSYVAQYLADADRRALRRVLPKARRPERWSPTMLAALRPARPCPACERRAQSAAYTVERLLRAMADGQVRDAWRKSDAFCWPHFQLALRLADEPLIPELLEVERRAFASLLNRDGGADRELALTLSGLGFR